MTTGRTIYIDPTAASGGDGSIGSPYNSWYSFTLQPGDTALQKGGTTSGGLAITASGTSSHPITIGSYGNGQAQMSGTVVLDGAQYVTVNGLDLSAGNQFGVMLTNSASNCTVQNCDIHGNLAGVYIDNGSANSDTIANNQIHDNDTSGIWFNGASASASSPAVVSGNTIYRNGQEGISLYGSYVTINGNTVVNNGISDLPGASAIHVIGSATSAFGNNNIITNNVVADQFDNSSFDGNGIDLDLWSGQNIVSNNLIFGNSGSGIVALSSGGNLIQNNLLTGNNTDPGGSHNGPAPHTEIYLGAASFAPFQTANNTISGNLLLATTPNTLAIQVDPLAAASSNSIGGNTLDVAGSGSVWSWSGTSGTSISLLNALTGGDDLLAPAGTAVTGLPTFSASMLNPTFTPHSNYYSTVSSAGSVLVASSTNENITVESGNNEIAGDGQNNVINVGGGGYNNVSGGAGNDTISAASGNNSLFGGPGNDVIIGGTGSDMLVGGSGNDLLIAGSGNEYLVGGRGNNTLVGGAGYDAMTGGGRADVFVLPGVGHDVITDFSPGVDLLDVAPAGITSLSGMIITGNSSGSLILFGSSAVILPGVDPVLLTNTSFIFANG